MGAEPEPAFSRFQATSATRTDETSPGFKQSIMKQLLGLCAAALFFSAPDVKAQTVGVSFELLSEFRTAQLRPLVFENVIPMAGAMRVRHFDADAGIFQIVGNRDQAIELSAELPDELSHATEEDFSIPIRLELAYNNTNELNAQEATLFETGNIRFPLHRAGDNSTPPGLPGNGAVAYIFVGGTIEPGDIPPGNYSAEIVFVVDFE